MSEQSPGNEDPIEGAAEKIEAAAHDLDAARKAELEKKDDDRQLEAEERRIHELRVKNAAEQAELQERERRDECVIEEEAERLRHHPVPGPSPAPRPPRPRVG